MLRSHNIKRIQAAVTKKAFKSEIAQVSALKLQSSLPASIIRPTLFGQSPFYMEQGNADKNLFFCSQRSFSTKGNNDDEPPAKTGSDTKEELKKAKKPSKSSTAAKTAASKKSTSASSSEEGAPKRKRRTKAEIEADKLAA
jgi:hypothetical protein